MGVGELQIWRLGLAVESDVACAQVGLRCGGDPEEKLALCVHCVAPRVDVVRRHGPAADFALAKELVGLGLVVEVYRFQDAFRLGGRGGHGGHRGYCVGNSAGGWHLGTWNGRIPFDSCLPVVLLRCLRTQKLTVRPLDIFCTPLASPASVLKWCDSQFLAHWSPCGG